MKRLCNLPLAGIYAIFIFNLLYLFALILFKIRLFFYHETN